MERVSVLHKNSEALECPLRTRFGRGRDSKLRYAAILAPSRRLYRLCVYMLDALISYICLLLQWMLYRDSARRQRFQPHLSHRKKLGNGFFLSKNPLPR